MHFSLRTRPTLRLAPLLAACALALAAAPVRAQVVVVDTVPTRPVARPAGRDSVTTASSRAAAEAAASRRAAAGDTLYRDSLGRRRISPKSAFLHSLVLPGWGQSKLGSPGRGAVYFGLETGSLFMVYKSQQRLRQAQRLQRDLQASGAQDSTTNTPLVRGRLAQREDWITLSAFWFFFSGADAFVAAHLADFDAHVGAMPTRDGVVVQGSVPVGKKP